MTDYNDGKWHGWNGGECPVHKKTTVDFLFATLSGDLQTNVKADDISWDHNYGAFRVVKAYREPRRFWIEPKTHHVIEIIQAPEDQVIAGYIRTVEVLE